MKSRHEQIVWRVRVVLACVGAAYVILLARAADLQIFKGDVLRELADRQQRRTLKTAPQRGEIVDREGEELAVSLMVDSAFANPSEIEDPDATARTIASITRGNPNKIAKLLRKKGSFVWVERQMEPAVAQRLRDADLKGIGFVKESKRYYPNGPLMGQTLGFVGRDAVGLEGLERFYDNFIRGESEVVQLQRDAHNRGILTNGLGEKLTAGGMRVELTVDKAIAYDAQRSLDEAVAKYKALNGVAIVQDVETGAILAMVTSPPFDPNRFSSYAVGYGRNRAIADVYEPGSTIKAVLLAAALEEKTVAMNSIFYCENGEFQVADRKIRDTHKHGWLTAADAVKVSSNICSLKIGKTLGKEKWRKHLEGFGFTQKTGIDLPGEAGGLLRPLRQWNEVLLATTSYGQGMGATPLQVLNAFTSIANGGKLLKPYTVARVIDGKGNVIHEGETEVLNRTVSAATAEKVRRVLETVVHDEDGTGTQAQVPGYYVAGKTGTAQKVDPETGLYSRTHYISTFAGFIPARDPRVSIIVSLNEPQGEIYGGVVAAPVFASIAAKAMERLHVPPDYLVVTKHDDGAKRADSYAAEPTGDSQFAGLTIREALRQARTRGVAIRPRGSGFAAREHCSDKGCEVVFKPL